MKDVNELLADVGHARNAIEKLAGMKLCDVIVAKQEIGAIKKTATHTLLQDTGRVNCLDWGKLNEISYIEALFLLYDIHRAEYDRRTLYGGDYATGGRFNSAECYLWHVNYLAGHILRHEAGNIRLRSVLATPFGTYYKALREISGKDFNSDLGTDFAEVWNKYNEPFEMCTMKPKEKGKATVEDVLRLFASIVQKSWAPLTRSVRTYEYEVRQCYRDIGRLLIEMPVHAYENRMKLSDVLKKYEKKEEAESEILNVSWDEIEDDLPFN